MFSHLVFIKTQEIFNVISNIFYQIRIQEIYIYIYIVYSFIYSLYINYIKIVDGLVKNLQK